MNTMKLKMKNFFSAVGCFFVTLGTSAKNLCKKIFSNSKSISGFAILMFFVLLAIFGPMFFPYDSATNLGDKYLGNSWQHPFGTDWLGRDVFRQVVAGTQSVLEIAFYTALFTVAIGTVLGILSGFVGGILDKIIMSITNIFLSIPSFPVLLLLAAIFTIEKPMEFAIILSVWGWAGLCRAIRVQVTSLKERDFIQICTVMHMSKPHIIFRELMPNLLSYVVINFVMSMRNAIMGSVGLMIIGLGNYDPTNWGAMINAAKSKGLINPDNIKILLYPLILIIIFQVAALLFANGLDETLNPRLKVQ